MKICMVTPEFLRKGKIATGLPNYLYRVSLALKKMGHIPIILTAGEVNEHVYYDGIEVYRKKCSVNYTFKSGNVNYIISSIKMSFLLNQELHSICKENNIDIIQFASLNGLALFYKESIPAIIRLSSYAKKYFECSHIYSKLEKEIQGKIECMAASRVQGIISPSVIMADAYAKDAHRKVTIVETPFLKSTLEYDYRIYKEVFLGKKYILFFGSLYDIKGIYVIIEIIQKFLKEHENYCFAFIGNIPQFVNENPVKTLFEKAGEYKDRVIYLKSLKHELLFPIIEKAEFIVLPSLMDNMPNTCIEAMSCGKVVVGTKGTSFEQLIEDGESGFLAQPGNSKSLYEKICCALHLPEDKKKAMELKAKKRIELLAPDITVKRLVHYYQYIMNKQ